ncbi:MAG: Rap1a/Tai family immunity protein [Proteobacteria bacterium]|nr:Rap1a/Tai family immunity protein [Pseudomonadota bacterium]
MRKLTLVLLAALIIVPTTTHAKLRADQLMSQCEASKDTLKGATDRTYCAGYIAGIIDMNAILPELHLPKIFCIPGKKGVSNDQFRLIFLKWAREHPAELHYSARASVLVALSETFPCKK